MFSLICGKCWLTDDKCVCSKCDCIKLSCCWSFSFETVQKLRNCTDKRTERWNWGFHHPGCCVQGVWLYKKLGPRGICGAACSQGKGSHWRGHGEVSGSPSLPTNVHLLKGWTNAPYFEIFWGSAPIHPFFRSIDEQHLLKWAQDLCQYLAWAPRLAPEFHMPGTTRAGQFSSAPAHSKAFQ